jgi:hypothetical protein
MTKQVFTNEHDSYKVEYRDQSAHHVIGARQEFYIYVSNPKLTPYSNFSGWFRGHPELHDSLVRLFKGRQAQKFIDLAARLHRERQEGKHGTR